MNRGTRPWSSEEIYAMRKLFAQGLTDRQIGEHLGRTYQAVETQRQILKLLRGSQPRTPSVNDTEAKRAARAFAMRSARQEACDRRDLTATFFGDPPPGFSALDRKRREEARKKDLLVHEGGAAPLAASSVIARQGSRKMMREREAEE